MALYVDTTTEPHSFGTLGSLRPNSSIPQNPSPKQLRFNNLYKVVDSFDSFDENTEKIVEADPVVIDEDLRLYYRVAIVDKTDEELLEEKRLEKKAAIQLNLYNALNGSVIYANNYFQLGNNGRENMSDTLNVFNTGVANAHGGYWRSGSNEEIVMSDATAKNLFVLSYVYGASCVRHSHQLKTYVNNANTVASVESIDINGSWPNNHIL